MKILPCLLIIVILGACVHPKVDEKGSEDSTLIQNQYYEFDIRKSLNGTKEEVLLSSLVKDINYIPLETTLKCLLSEVKKIEVFNNNIFVRDNKGLFQFDIHGKFIRQIGSYGNGPGEYGMVLDFCIVRNSGDIFLKAYPSGLILVYDLESGAYKRSFRLGFDISEMIEFPPGKITFYTYDKSIAERSPSDNEIYVCDSIGTVLDTIPDSRPGNAGNLHSGGMLYFRNGELSYMHDFQDSLYVLSPDIQKRTYVSFGIDNKTKRHEIQLKRIFGVLQYTDFIYVDEIFESDKYFFINTGKGIGFYISSEETLFLYDKQNEMLIQTSKVKNDIDGGMDFRPAYIFDNTIISHYQSYQILEHYGLNKDKTNFSEDFVNLAKNLNENSNPVLVFCKLR